MSENAGNDSFHEFSLTVTAFLGGISFAALVLLVQSRNNISIPAEFPWFYLDLLLTGTAISSVFLIVSSVGMIRAAAGEMGSEEKFTIHMRRFASYGFISILIMLPLFVLPFLLIGAVIVAIVEAYTLFIYLKHLRTVKKTD